MSYPTNEDGLTPLTRREIEVIELVADGLSNREIADSLVVTVHTVKVHLKNVFAKLEASKRTQAVARARELGLLRDAPTNTAQTIHPPHNLPDQITPFVGRENELAELAKRLSNPETRLITIVAPGGMGKTRLALEMASRFIAIEERHVSPQTPFTDGIFFVALQPLSDPAQIVPQIASSLDFRFVLDERKPEHQLLDYLSQKQMLLVIDNWEHLLDGVTFVTKILSASPNIKILATSREKLNLSSESIYVLGGLHFPKLEDTLDYDAVKLLVQSAQRVKPDWEVTQRNLDTVVRVCRLTQGMPLGIVLAASWLDVLTLDRIASEIQKSVDFLKTEMRDIPERQRSIRAVFDWTWQQLRDAEQQVFMRLSVFRGGFIIDAAEVVAGATMRNLQVLVNKAFLVHDNSGRYDVHELLRQYGETELVKLPEIARKTRDDHAGLFADYLVNYYDRSWGSDPLVDFQGGRVEFDNIMVAWEWAVQNHYDELLLRMVQGMGWLFYNLNRFQEGTELFRRTVERIDQITDEKPCEPVTTVLAAYSTWLGTYFMHETQMRDIIERVSAFFECLDMAQASYELLDGYLTFGCALRHSQPHRAQGVFDKVIALSGQDAVFEESLMPLALWQWGYTQVNVLGKTAGAIEKFKKALAIYQRIDSYYGIMDCEAMIANILVIEKDYEAAHPILKDCIQRYEAIGENYNLLALYSNLILIAVKQNIAPEARQFIAKALPLSAEIGWIRNSHYLFCTIAGWYHYQSEPKRATEIAAFASHDLPFTPNVGMKYELDELLPELEANLSPDEFEQAIAYGQALDWETLIKELLEEFEVDASS
jgi:predicted ATPase/DNA-binding CsgD family transcriptional regulator